MTVGPQTSVLAPRFSRVLTALVIGICSVTEISLIAYGNTGALLRATPGIALMACASYTFFWAPRLRIDPSHIEIANPLRTVSIPWRAVIDIGTQWSLSIETAHRKYSAWSAPADSPWGSLARLNRDVLGRASLGAPSPGADSARVRSIVVAQWQSHRESSSTESLEVTIRPHTTTLAILIGLSVLTTLGIIWP